MLAIGNCSLMSGSSSIGEEFLRLPCPQLFLIFCFVLAGRTGILTWNVQLDSMEYVMSNTIAEFRDFMS